MNPTPPRRASLKRPTRSWLKGGEWVAYRMLLLLLLLLAVLLLSSVPRPCPERNGKMVADGPVCPSPQSSAPLDLGSSSTRPYSTGYKKDLGCGDSLLRRTLGDRSTYTPGKDWKLRQGGSAKNMQGLPVGEPNSAQTGLLEKAYPLGTASPYCRWIGGMLALPHKTSMWLGAGCLYHASIHETLR